MKRDLDTVLSHFAALVRVDPRRKRTQQNPNLDELLAFVGAAVAPNEVDVEAVVAQLDELAAQVYEPTVEGVIDLLFRRMGFEGNRDDYYATDNSRLDLVLENRVGIPITLSAVMVEVARRVDVPLDMCAMPGHVLVGAGGTVWYDAFDGGRAMNVRDCELLFDSIKPRDTFDRSMLEPTSTYPIVARAVQNLQAYFMAFNHRAPLLTMAELKVLLPTRNGDDLVFLAEMKAEFGQLAEAADLYESVLDRDDLFVPASYRDKARKFRAMLN